MTRLKQHRMASGLINRVFDLVTCNSSSSSSPCFAGVVVVALLLEHEEEA